MKDLKTELQTYFNPTETKVALNIIREWLIQKREEATKRRRNGEAFFGNQILNELLNDVLDELKI